MIVSILVLMESARMVTVYAVVLSTWGMTVQ